eukprot:TRINITY_DN60953_c0_g2_i1.p2 TRINITY_DN60953_c0_g2~~TRINITY_DN60953_c0_g2_i1.p2  ORF type:complete len:101 (-),score=10.92 TRINITY_DN60953_c0_g2_i1:66-368(-)
MLLWMAVTFTRRKHASCFDSWLNLGDTMHSSSEVARVNNMEYNNTKCYLMALSNEVDVVDSDRKKAAWTSLGNNIFRDGSVLVGGTEYTKAECLAKGGEN